MLDFIEKFGLGGEDNALNTEGVDDRDRAVMGSFKNTEVTKGVREVIMSHIPDFIQYLKNQMENKKTITLCDTINHQVCPQSVMMETELFHHFFDYCDETIFLEAVEKVLVFEMDIIYRS